MKQFVEWYEQTNKSKQCILNVNETVVNAYKAYLMTDATWQPQYKIGQKPPERKHYGDITKNKKLSVVKGFLKWLYKSQKITENLADTIEVKRIRKETVNEDLITYKDALVLINKECIHDRDKAIIAALIDSGMRRAELLRLRYKDVKIEDGGIAFYVTKERQTDKSVARRIYCFGVSQR